jgi:hypothetical protein
MTDFTSLRKDLDYSPALHLFEVEISGKMLTEWFQMKSAPVKFHLTAHLAPFTLIVLTVHLRAN